MARGRTIVFVDNSNIFHGQRNAGWPIDWRKLQAYMAREGEIWQTFFFASVTEPPKYEQTEFYKFIKNEMRFEVQLFKLGSKYYQCPNCGAARWVRVEKGVDVALATKLLTLANERAYDTAVLVGADRDFLGTIQAVKDRGLRVEIYAWRGSISDEMCAASSAPVVYLNDIRQEIEYVGKPDEEAEKMTSEIEVEDSGGASGEH
jgi:uncharacterized LabA/DUF88 family protein